MQTWQIRHGVSLNYTENKELDGKLFVKGQYLSGIITVVNLRNKFFILIPDSFEGCFIFIQKIIM